MVQARAPAALGRTRKSAKPLSNSSPSLVPLTSRWLWRLAALGSLMALSACAGGTSAAARGIDKERQTKTIAMWKKRCLKSGEFIHDTVEGV
jgi:hypothetical protein